MLFVQTAFPGSEHHSDSVTQELCALLDTLAALRIDLGHDANGKAASPPLGPNQIREIRLLVDGAIVQTKAIIGKDCPPHLA